MFYRDNNCRVSDLASLRCRDRRSKRTPIVGNSCGISKVIATQISYIHSARTYDGIDPFKTGRAYTGSEFVSCKRKI